MALPAPARDGAPTPEQRAAAEALAAKIAAALAAADWMQSPAPAGWSELQNVR